MNYPASKKFDYLNKTILYTMAEADINIILKNFTEDSIQIFNADFGFARGKFGIDNKKSVTYASKNLPCEPVIPIRKNEDNTLFDNNVNVENYDTEICRFMKSYLIIPVRYVDHVYGNIVLCFKKQHNFTRDELVLTQTIGNALAQSVTINWLLEQQRRDLDLAQKQKETEVLLTQEKAKTEFIANATHELRTPLAIMKADVDLALMSKDAKSANIALKTVNHEIKILAEILKDLSLLTATDNNLSNVVDKNPVNLTALLTKIAERLAPMAEHKNIKISVKKNRGLYVLGDEKYLEKLFLNITRNAVTYGKKNGSIAINAGIEKDHLKVNVVDDGIGIEEEDLPKIFDRFYRVDKAHSSAQGSHSGLGLPIAKWAAEVHGGSIEVKSTPGVGSVFRVNLPILKKKEPRHPKARRV